MVHSKYLVFAAGMWSAAISVAGLHYWLVCCSTPLIHDTRAIHNSSARQHQHILLTPGHLFLPSRPRGSEDVGQGNRCRRIEGMKNTRSLVLGCCMHSCLVKPMQGLMLTCRVECLIVGYPRSLILGCRTCFQVARSLRPVGLRCRVQCWIVLIQDSFWLCDILGR